MRTGPGRAGDRRCLIGLAAGLAAAGMVIGAGSGVLAADDRPRLVESGAIELDGLVPVALSPDGSRLVAVGPADAVTRSQVCVLDTASLAPIACTQPGALVAGVSERGIAWAPDGSSLAIAEAGHVTGLDGDLWRMDAATGALANLDDDGYDRFADPILGLPDQPLTMPWAPAFTPDGSGITYGRLRTAAGALESEEIVTVPVAGGAATRLLELPGDPSGQTFFGGGWSPDGTVFYATVHSDALAPDDGVLAVAGDGSGRSALVLGTTGDQAGSPAVAQVAADGTHLLAFHHRQAASYGGATDAWSMVDLVGGTSRVVRNEDEILALYTYEGLAGFSPDGRWLLTVTRGTSPDGQVWVRPVDGSSPGQALSPDGVGPAASVVPGLPLSWASGGTVLVPAGPASGTATLLTIEGGD